MNRIYFLVFSFILSLSMKAQYTPMAAKGYEFKYTKHDSGLATPYRDTGSIIWGTTRPGSLRTRPADSSLYLWGGTKWNKLATMQDVSTPTWEQTLLVNPNLTQGWNINLGSNDFEWDDAVFYGIVSQRGYWTASDSGVLSGRWRIDSPMNYLKNVNGSLQDLSLVPKKYVDSLIALPNSNSWNITGNAGTVDVTNFIGTTDNVPFNIRVNDKKAGRIDPSRSNTVFGYRSAEVDIGHGNTSVGSTCFTSNTTGHKNTAIGALSLRDNTTGYYNTAIGNQAMMDNVSGVKNTSLGFNTNMNSGALDNTTTIGANAYVTQSNSMILGSINGVNGASADTKVGIGTTAPSERLHVVGNLRLVNGSEANGKYLQSDANGVATWADVPAETGTVESVSVINANGFDGTVANANTTPAITIKTTVNGMVKGNGTAISAATPDVDYATPAYADAKVEDAIVNGVTTKAPSQNAVYDALALKLNITDLPVYTASNGLTKSTNDFQLGGALAKNTSISLTDYNFDLRDTTEYGTNRFTNNKNGGWLQMIAKSPAFDSAVVMVNSEDSQASMYVIGGNSTSGVLSEKQNLSLSVYNAVTTDFARIFFNPKSIQIDATDSVVYEKTIDNADSSRQLANTGWVKRSLAGKVTGNALITGATKTKITYDAKGLVTAGTNATTDDIQEGGNIGSPQYFTDERAQDAVGSMVDATLVYNDGLPSLGRAAISGDITVASGSNTAAITGNVIVDADINTNAAISATKIADGLVDNTEFNYLNGVTSGIQSQLNSLSTNKVTKGGDAGAFAIGTTNNNDLTIKLNNTDRWTFDGANGYLRRGSGSPYFGLQFYGTGAGSTITMGDVFDATTPYISAREKGGTDTDQWEFYAQKGIYMGTGTFGATARLNIQQDGDIIYGGETQVAGAEHTFIGDADVSGNVNVQGNLTAGNILRASAALNFPSTAATAVSTLTITVTGADVGDPVFLGVPNGSVTTTSTYWAWVSAANTVSVRFSPKATEDPASADFTVVVFD